MKQNVQFDADTLLILAKVIELKSLSAAASVLGIPRSTVSRKIIKLEEELGIKLLRKNTRQISVTDLGARIYTHAINIQNEISMVRSVLGGSKEDPQGTVRVAIPVFLGAEFASKVGVSFLKKISESKTGNPSGGYDCASSERRLRCDLGLRPATGFHAGWQETVRCGKSAVCHAGTY